MDVKDRIRRAEESLRGVFDRIDRVEEKRTAEVLSAFQHHEVAVRHFAPSAGYSFGRKYCWWMRWFFAGLNLT